jgi:hypothetical protein
MELPLESTNLDTNADRIRTTMGVASLERHYTVAELSKRWIFSQTTIRRLFMKEPGVIRIVRPESKSKRGYISLRIPERIAQRVYQRLQGLS